MRLIWRDHTSPDTTAVGRICHAAIGAPVRARLRTNPGFHRLETMPMVLIGNGTGIAGLRALLREAELAGVHGHWLLFGERDAAARPPVTPTSCKPGQSSGSSYKAGNG
ncbi:iron-uptake factor [Xanthomonas citri pv. aurantifolii str. ICPB 11122]|nr:iron-uptake factor [Xanthomonas citri pv. aurantifolii str. ICPB 11122]